MDTKLGSKWHRLLVLWDSIQIVESRASVHFPGKKVHVFIQFPNRSVHPRWSGRGFISQTQIGSHESPLGPSQVPAKCSHLPRGPQLFVRFPSAEAWPLLDGCASHQNTKDDSVDGLARMSQKAWV